MSNKSTNKKLVPTIDATSEKVTTAVKVFDETTKTLLPVAEVKNIVDATLLVNTALAMHNKVDYAVCKIFSNVCNTKLYKGDFETFDKWAQSQFGIKKAQAYNYVKVGEYINENGTESTLFHSPAKDFTVTALISIAEKLTHEQADKLANEGLISSFMSVSELKKVLAVYAGKEEVEEGEETDEKGEDTETAEVTTDETETETDEKGEVKKEAKVVVKFTKEECRNLIDEIRKYKNEKLLAFAYDLEQMLVNLK